jgi:hypothetical protein
VDRDQLLHALAAMTDDEVADTLAAARGDGPEPSPMEKAANALRRHRGADRKTKASKDDAAAAMLRWAHSGRES